MLASPPARITARQLENGSTAPMHPQFTSGEIWRRARDSNPRYPFGYVGFQDRCHQPLGQLSASGNPSRLTRLTVPPISPPPPPSPQGNRMKVFGAKRGSHSTAP